MTDQMLPTALLLLRSRFFIAIAMWCYPSLLCKLKVADLDIMLSAMLECQAQTLRSVVAELS